MENMEVTFGNTFIESDAGTGFVVGFLTMAVLTALESAVTKVFFKSKRKEISRFFSKAISFIISPKDNNEKKDLDET